MTHSRRTFLKAASATAAWVTLGERAWGAPSSTAPPSPDRITTRDLALAAINAARDAGATYADIRIDASMSQGTSVWRSNTTGPASYTEEFTYGIRVIANGQWGFAGDQYPSTDAAANCARAAVAQATINAIGRKQSIELAPAPPVINGSWAAPIEIDPFSVPIGEWQDALLDATRAAFTVRGIQGASAGLSFSKTVRTFASTDGSFILQTFWSANPNASVYAGVSSDGRDIVMRRVAAFAPALKGYEVLRSVRLAEAMVTAAEAAVAAIPSQPVVVGRYDIVLSASVMARLVAGTLGSLTSMDRAIGREAHYRGTSYTGSPASVLGTPVTSPLVTLVADRTAPDGLATVKWDDEGVAPDAWSLVDHGVLVDYQTTRESAVLLGDWYQKHGRPLRSHGCASGGGLSTPQETMANLTLAPARTNASVHDLIAGVSRGFYLSEDASVSTDEQLLRGQLVATSVQEIRNGQMVGYVRDAAIDFRTPDLWKSLDAIGGPEAQELCATGGQSVHAVPGRFRQMAVVSTAEVV